MQMTGLTVRLSRLTVQILTMSLLMAGLTMQMAGLTVHLLTMRATLTGLTRTLAGLSSTSIEINGIYSINKKRVTK